MTLRRRLTLTVLTLLAAGYLTFATVSVTLLDETLRSDIVAKITTLARAASDLIDDDHGHASIDADDVAQFNALHGSDEHLGIYDTSGRLIFGEPRPAADQARRFTVVQARSVHDKHDLGRVFAWRDSGWVNVVRATAIVTFLVTGTALCIVAFIFSGIYARALLAPVERVASLAERLETSDLSQRLNAKGRDELARLCASFDRMLERLQASFENERRFVSDASHELRAPLAVVRAETDLALRRDRSAGEYRLALESIGRETRRLEELVERLLQTMRRQALVKTSEVDILALASGLAKRLEHAASSIRIETHASDTRIRAHCESVERALSAVLHNSLIHGNGDVRIALEERAERVEIAISDRGPGFSEAALEHATERFWRGDAARTRGGTGLGLSIARTLIEAQGGELHLSNGPGGGATVTIALPSTSRLRAPV